jgi:uncharacterized membrane protein
MENSIKNSKSIDIIVVAVVTLVAAALAFIAPASNSALRIWTLPLVFILPGYALTAALFVERQPELLVRVVFWLGLSVVVVILGGVVLNLTPAGMHAGSWALFLASVTLGACVMVLIRRKEQGMPPMGLLRTGHSGLPFFKALVLGLAALIVCGAIVLSITDALQQPYAGFTQLWILPENGSAGAKDSVRLGVSNMESTATAYHLVVDMDGKMVKQWATIDLQQYKQWQATLALPPSGHTGPAKVEVLLYRAQAPTTVYRHVVLWVSV